VRTSPDQDRAIALRDWFVDVIGEIEFRDWRFMVGGRDDAPGQFHLVIEFEEACIVTGEITTQRSRKWLLSEHMTRSEIIQTAWLAVQTALMHEARESFMWRGELIFGPHFDVEALHELCVRKATDVRPPQVSPSPSLPVSGSASPA